MHMQYKARPDDALALPSFRGLYLLTGLVLLLVAADLLFWIVGWNEYRSLLGWDLALLAALLGGSRILYGALHGILEGDLGADVALAIALLASVALREYWVGAEVVLIAMIGESLEALTFQRTHRELRRILELRPRIVRVRRGEEELEVPAEEVVMGETAIVRPGERVSVDGVVIAGRSTLDQSSLTGESLPVDKGPGERVYAGTLNQFGALEIRVEATGKDTTLGQIARLVAEARRQKARIERVADTMARYFLPFVLSLAAITWLVSNASALTSGSGVQWQQLSWMPTLAVLVVACPCALILATPAAVMAALAVLARRGVLIRGGAALERLARVTHIAFDKTGTLTQGHIQITACVALNGWSEDQVLALAAAAEMRSEHAIARAVVHAAQQRQLTIPAVELFTALPGAGVRARLKSEEGATSEVWIGNRRLMEENGVNLPPAALDAIARVEEAGQSALLVARADEIVGVLGIADTIRPEANTVLRELRALGIREFTILTGDRPAPTRQVAQQVGIDRFHAELHPGEKSAWLAAWRETADNGLIAMVGDGVNDAPALAAADVGIALAGSGTDIAAEAGDIIVLGDPLRSLPMLVRLAREMLRIITQNILVFAFAVNLIGIALTGWIMPTWSDDWLRRSPVAAAIFHQVGSVLVLLNSMRLLWFERRQDTWFGRWERWAGGMVQAWIDQLRPIAGAALWMLAWRWQLLRFALYAGLASYLSWCVVFVQPNEVAVVRRFGEFQKVLGPGPHLRLPPPWDWIERERPDLVRDMEIGLGRLPMASAEDAGPIEWNSLHQRESSDAANAPAIMLTGDQSLVEVSVSIQYRIRDIAAFMFHVRDAAAVLRAAAEGVLTEVLATRPLLSDDASDREREIVAGGRADLEREIRRLLQQRVDALGIGVELLEHGVCLEDVHPPLDVVDAFRDVSSAFKEMERMKNEGDAAIRDTVIKAGGVAAWRKLGTTTRVVDDAMWNELLPELEGEAATELAQARAFAIARREDAEGEAQRFELRERARASAPEPTDWRLYVDTIGQTLARKNKLILDPRSAGRRHLYLGYPAPGSLLPPPEPERMEEPE